MQGAFIQALRRSSETNNLDGPDKKNFLIKKM